MVTCFLKIQFFIFVSINTQTKIKNIAMKTLIPEFNSGSMSMFVAKDNGPIKMTNNPPPSRIRIHIVKMNPKIEAFMIILHPLKMQLLFPICQKI